MSDIDVSRLPNEAINTAINAKIQSMTQDEIVELVRGQFQFLIWDATPDPDDLAMQMLRSAGCSEEVAALLAVVADLDKTIAPGPTSSSAEVYAKAMLLLGAGRNYPKNWVRNAKQVADLIDPPVKGGEGD